MGGEPSGKTQNQYLRVQNSQLAQDGSRINKYIKHALDQKYSVSFWEAVEVIHMPTDGGCFLAMMFDTLSIECGKRTIIDTTLFFSSLAYSREIGSIHPLISCKNGLYCIFQIKSNVWILLLAPQAAFQKSVCM